MPLLAAFLATVFGGLFSQLVRVFGVRTAVATAAIGSIATLTGALIAAMAALAGTLQFGTIPAAEVISLGLWLFAPEGAAVAVAAVFTCDAACALYALKVRNVRMIAGV